MSRAGIVSRRQLLAGAAALSGCAKRAAIQTPSAPAFPATVPPLAPVRAEVDRIFRTTVCLRPFRAAGPRLDVERVGDKTVIHNYGHGGSGWSLSWGSSTIAMEKALATGHREIAVIGAGALGLTSALLLQQAGAKVTIYAKERPPDVRSARATGSWTPDSRIALTNAMDAGFPALWEKMCRRSFHVYEGYLGLPGNPIEWLDGYFLSDGPNVEPRRAAPSVDPLPFAHFGDRVADLTPRARELAPGTHPFPTRSVRQTTRLTFNIAAYSHQLVQDFLIEGGRIVRTEFHAPNELAALREPVIVNATGYGARQLWSDESIVPVRGQIAWLIPQPDVHYSLAYRGVHMIGRRDGIVIQAVGAGEMEGYNVADEQPNRQEAEAAVNVIAELYQQWRNREAILLRHDRMPELCRKSWTERLPSSRAVAVDSAARWGLRWPQRERKSHSLAATNRRSRNRRR